MYTWSLVMTRPRWRGCGRPSSSHSSRTKAAVLVAGDLHEALPLGVAREAGFSVACVAGSGRGSGRIAAGGEALEELAIEADFDVLGPAHAFEVILILALEADAELVVAGGGEDAADGDAATGAEGEILALAVVLHDVERDLEGFDRRAIGRQADGEARSLAGDGEVTFDVRGGD